MSIKLTARQQQILEIIKSEIANTGFPPTRAEIAKTLGFKSANAAEDHLRALQKKGIITIIPNTSRGIRLVESSIDSTNNSTPTTPTTIIASNDNNFILPVIGRVAAGEPVLAQENIEKEIQIDLNLFKEKPDYLLKVYGLSMINAGILDGDLLAVKKHSDAHNGQIVVARIDNEVTVKRFQKDKGQIQLLSENPDFQPIIVDPSIDFAIEGLAVGLIRNQNFNKL